MSAVYEHGLSVGAQCYHPGTPEARVLVRATLLHGPDFATGVTCGFDLTAEGALKLADRLTTLAGELKAAEVKK